jgi:hypothetical protein
VIALLPGDVRQVPLNVIQTLCEGLQPRRQCLLANFAVFHLLLP